MPNPFGLNPVKVEKYYAYTRKEKYYGHIWILLNYNDFKVGEWIDIDTKDFKVRGEITHVKDKMIWVKMEEIAHKGEIN